VFGAGLLICLQPAENSASVIIGEEFGLIREIMDLGYVN